MRDLLLKKDICVIALPGTLDRPPLPKPLG